MFPGKLQTFPGEFGGVGQVVSIDLNYGSSPEDLAAQIGVACLRKALRLLQLSIGLLLLAKPGVCQRAEQISFNREIARNWIGHAWAIKEEGALPAGGLGK